MALREFTADFCREAFATWRQVEMIATVSAACAIPTYVRTGSGWATAAAAAAGFLAGSSISYSIKKAFNAYLEDDCGMRDLDM